MQSQQVQIMVRKNSSNSISGALFEDDYVIRTLGRIGHEPETALTELVANAWDAGAFNVKVIVPEHIDGLLTVEDNGHGMTKEQFKARWMTLGYDRTKSQGIKVKFSGEYINYQRLAFGRNGVGRHGLLCFADQYKVETWCDGWQSTFVVGTRNQASPFYIESESSVAKTGHGTRLSVVVERNIPDAEKIRTILSARFLHDPQFVVTVNGQSVPLLEHEGLVEQEDLKVSGNLSVKAYVIDTTKTAKSTRYQGVAFWVNNRLVGNPSWLINFSPVVDGRSRFAKRYAIVISAASDMIQEVEPDWSRFKNTEISASLFNAVNAYAQKMLEKLSADFVQESSEEVLVRNREGFRELNPIAQAEVANFTTSLVKEQPSISPETLNLAVQAVIRLEKSRSGIGLLEKLMKLDDQDLDGLDRILSQWTVQDAVTVLDEIDRRLSVVAAIEKLSGDEHADELHTLHPLVTHARWLFGPEFDSPEFSSNTSLKTAAFKVLNIEKSESSFINSRKRPDIVMRADATFSVVGTESFDSLANNLSTVRDVLIIELKKERSAIDREAMTQADGYVQDFLTCGLLDGSPFITAFVVGHSIADKTAEKKEVEISSVKKGRIFAVTYHQLARTANQRLLRLKEKIPSRYEEMSGYELANKVMNVPTQAPVV